MTTRDYWRRFIASPVGIVALILALLVVLGAWRIGLPPFLALVVGFAAFGLLSLLGLVSGLGPRLAAREAERESRRGDEGRAAEAGALGDRLARLRLPDPEIAAARDLLVLEAGRLAGAVATSSKAPSEAGPLVDPRAPALLEEALELIQAWLQEADESSVERRFDAPDAHPFPEAKKRTLAALADKRAALLRLRDQVETPPPDRLAADEELR